VFGYNCDPPPLRSVLTSKNEMLDCSRNGISSVCVMHGHLLRRSWLLIFSSSTVQKPPSFITATNRAHTSPIIKPDGVLQREGANSELRSSGALWFVVAWRACTLHDYSRKPANARTAVLVSTSARTTLPLI
jgi:hypothetical protein